LLYGISLIVPVFFWMLCYFTKEFSKDKAEEITKEIRTIIKERKQIQDILNKYGWECLSTPDRVARYHVFQASSRISAPISRLPERSYPGDEISHISIRTCQSPVTTHSDTQYGPCIVVIAYMATMKFMRNSTVYCVIQHTVLLRTSRTEIPQTSVVPDSEHWTQWTSGVNTNLF